MPIEPMHIVKSVELEKLLEWVVRNPNIRFTQDKTSKKWSAMDCRYGIKFIVEDRDTMIEAIEEARTIVNNS